MQHESIAETIWWPRLLRLLVGAVVVGVDGGGYGGPAHHADDLIGGDTVAVAVLVVVVIVVVVVVVAVAVAAAVAGMMDDWNHP